METITVNQLASIVRKMRAQQTEYFRWKSKRDLLKCKKLEYQIDQLLKTIPTTEKDSNNPENDFKDYYSQQNLFL